MDQNELLKIIERAAEEKATELDLSGKGITSLTSQIGQLTNLTKLWLFGNQLTSVPAELGKLKNLTYLSLSANNLTSVPAELGQLENLTKLSLNDNKLTSIPAEFGKLTNLTELDLHYNQLTSIPPELGKVTNLTELRLDNNQLTSIPADLGKLTNLTTLWLNDNQLTNIPAELGKLTRLTQFWLLHNQLTNIPPELGHLTNLMYLHLSNNQLSSIPKELGELTNLRDLGLHVNQLTSVPSELGQLKHLARLDMYGNRLASIPAELGNLTSLDTLMLGGNKALTSPPPEVLKQGTKAILAYLRELAKGKKERYEAKLLILGDGDEGKTCVSRALRGLDFKKQIRTEGVEVAQWTFSNPKIPGDSQTDITLNIWDFEGQEINHQSHQFFLTTGALCLLVINGRRQFKIERAEYWLDTIRSRAPGNRVILVASECENTTPSWPLDKLKAGYGDLLRGEKWYFAVGCESEKGIEDLAAEIKAAAADMDVMGSDWPVNYEKAEDEIRSRAKTAVQMARTDLYAIFEDRRISKTNFEAVAEHMATLGVITQFKESAELGDFVVLNPQWLTKGISQVMEDPQLDKDKGEITCERMRSIWDREYQGLYPTFHSCMKEFELCYDMEDEAGCLVPLRFGDARPEMPWSNIKGAKERRIEYRMSARPPKGIMSRFIVKTHYMIAKTSLMPKGVYWQNGVFLRTGEGEFTSEALCEFDEIERVMSIRVRAAFPQNMIEQLHACAKAVFGFFEGLKIERKYGCMKFENKSEQECEGAHAERRILFALSRKNEIDCERGWHVVDPRRLVFGFSSFGEDALTVKELREELAKKPKWAENLIGDIETSLVWIDKIYDKVFTIRQRQEELAPEIVQRVALQWRDYLDKFDEILDNRDFNSAPAVVSIMPVDCSAFNPKNWFEKEYNVIPYCEYSAGVHPVSFSVPLQKPRQWWQKTAPKLAVGIKVLSAGIKIACAGLPLALDTELFEAMKNEVEFMKELADHMELEGGAESDISLDVGVIVERIEGKGKFRVFQQLTGEDEKRIVRMQLAELFEQIAPKNYKARQWGELRRVKMPDNTYRWLCAKHAAEYKK